LSKETYYFPHDSNARSDPKMVALKNDFGMEGIGIYWALIEILHEQKNGKIEKFPKLFDGLASEFKIKKEALLQAIEAMVKHFFLLQEDEKWIWSNRVIQNLEERKDKCRKKIEAGRLGGIKSGISRKKDEANEAPLEANEQKESKVKEIKTKKDSLVEGKPPTKKVFLETSQEYILANLLFTEITKLRPTMKKPNMQKWASDIDLMIRVDNRSIDEIKDLIIWCQKDTFWKTNILSTQKLRKQFDVIAIKKESETPKESPDDKWY